jgi:outer membrane receptor protein involved in Fe transport
MLTALGLVLYLTSVHQPGPSDDTRVRGAVVDDAGMPVGAADVELICGERRRRVLTTTAGGFVVRGTGAAECTVQATKAGKSTAPARVLPVGGSGAAPIVLQFEPGRFTEEVVVSPSRGGSEWVSRVPESVTVTSRDALDRRPFTLLGQALREQPGVMVQQTTTAQVSPVIRGFTGQSNLYLIDGVRLNASTWRSGPSQYFSWIDGGSVERLEVVRGAGALQYGGDGLGGAIQIIPDRPLLRAPGAGRVGRVSVELTGASADGMAGGRVNARMESARFSVSGGIGLSDVDDLRAGGGRDSRAAVTRFLGITAAPPNGRLRGTGFGTRSGFAHVVAAAGQTGVLVGSYFAATQQDVLRYDRMDGGDGLHQSGFAPQRLDLALVRYEAAPGSVVDRWSVTASLNRQQDGRFERARPTARLDTQESVTRALGYQAQASRFWGNRHQLLAGAEVYDERVSAERTLIEASGTSTAARPDVPSGTRYVTMGAFAQQVTEAWRDRLWVRGGIRYTAVRFSTRADAALAVTDDEVSAQAMAFQGGVVLAATRFLNVTANMTRGFRAPNAADLGGIGLTGGGGFEISPQRARTLGARVGSNEGVTAVDTGRSVGALGPEVADTYEAGVKVHGARVSASFSVFDVELRDTIQRRTMIVNTPVVGTDIAGFTIVRQDAQGRVFVAEDSRPVVTRVNLDRARIVGIDGEASVVIGRGWSATASASLANGRVRGGDYLRRMPPAMGGGTLRWASTGEAVWIEGAVRVVCDQTRMNAGDLSDARIGARRTAAQIASYFNGTAVDQGLVAGGRLLQTGETLAQVQSRVLGGQAASQLFSVGPGFSTVGLRAGWRVHRDLTVIAIGENLTDRNYRWHGSGVDAPGRSIQLRIRYDLPVR